MTIIAHRAEMGTGAARTSLPMIVADEMDADWSRVTCRPGAGRRGEIRQPGHRRLAQHAPFHSADAPVRRRGAHDAGAGGGQALGRRSLNEVEATNPRGRAHGIGQEARLRRARGRCRGRCRRRRCSNLEAQGPERLPLYRQGHGHDRRSARHHDRQGDLRPRRHAPGHEVRRRRAAAGGRRQGGFVRRDRGDEGARASRRSSRSRAAAAGRRSSCRSAASPWSPQHRGGDQGPRGAEDRLGRRAERDLQFRRLPKRCSRTTCASRARSSATRAMPTRR